MSHSFSSFITQPSSANMDTEISPSAIGLVVHPQTQDDDYGIADPTRFDIDVDLNKWAKLYIEDLETRKLWHRTCLQRITARENGPNFLDVQNSFVHDDAAMNLDPSKKGNSNAFELISISRHLETKEDNENLPNEERGLLRVSPRVLKHLASTYHIPTAFITAFDHAFDTYGTTFRRQSHNEWDYWCLIPCSVATGIGTCEVRMDPINHIYFERQGVIINRHTYAIYMKRDCDTRRLRVFVVIRGGGRDQQPLAQVQSALERRSSKDLDDSPCFVLLIYITFTLRWWGDLFIHFNLELAEHVIDLQREISEETEGFIHTTKVLNVTLHTMAAHLHRYKTELQRVGGILSDLRKHRKEMTYKPKSKPGNGEDEKQQDRKQEEEEEELSTIDREGQKIEQLASQLVAISGFADEMEKKIQNTLALLFNQIQAINDRTLQGILNASQQENRISQRLSLASHMLSRSMKRDSIAMKTIAMMTLVFLPGATFAAVFAMPFFTENKYLSSPSQVWIWVILTAVCTAFAFGGYIHLVKRGEMTLGDPEDDSDAAVLSDGATTSNAPSAVGNGGNTSSSGNKRHWRQRVSRRTSQSSIELSSRRRS